MTDPRPRGPIGRIWISRGSRASRLRTACSVALAVVALAACKHDAEATRTEALPTAVVEEVPLASRSDVAAEAPADAPVLANSAGTEAAADDSEQLAALPTHEAAADPGVRKVLILGDSLAATGFGALLERKLDAHPEIDCARKGKSASGLARPDFFDWIAEAKRQVERRQPDLVIVIMGGNDGQDLTARKKGGRRVRWLSDGWEQEYRVRLDAFLSEIAAPGRTVMWLGLPTMGLRSLEKKLETIRRIQNEAVASLGPDGVYMDTAPLVTGASGELLHEAVVGNAKKPSKIRAEDRIHFTMSGSQYFADQVFPEVVKVLGFPSDPPPIPDSEVADGAGSTAAVAPGAG